MKYETNIKSFKDIDCGLCLFVLKCTGYDKFKYKGSIMQPHNLTLMAKHF